MIIDYKTKVYLKIIMIKHADEKSNVNRHSRYGPKFVFSLSLANSVALPLSLNLTARYRQDGFVTLTHRPTPRAMCTEVVRLK